MPLIRVKGIREMSSEDRSKRLTEFKTELVRLKTMVHAGGTIENPARIKTLRRAIAKIITVENEDSHKAGKARTERKRK
jgi:large subunit ribosomal protein L29